MGQSEPPAALWRQADRWLLAIREGYPGSGGKRRDLFPVSDRILHCQLRRRCKLLTLLHCTAQALLVTQGNAQYLFTNSLAVVVGMVPCCLVLVSLPDRDPTRAWPHRSHSISHFSNVAWVTGTLESRPRLTPLVRPTYRESNSRCIRRHIRTLFKTHLHQRGAADHPRLRFTSCPHSKVCSVSIVPHCDYDGDIPSK